MSSSGPNTGRGHRSSIASMFSRSSAQASASAASSKAFTISHDNRNALLALRRQLLHKEPYKSTIDGILAGDGSLFTAEGMPSENLRSLQQEVSSIYESSQKQPPEVVKTREQKSAVEKAHSTLSSLCSGDRGRLSQYSFALPPPTDAGATGTAATVGTLGDRRGPGTGYDENSPDSDYEGPEQVPTSFLQ
ncbi:hypothetical protein I316_00980 [Kwoniella heveanensis BCC8398]|uniref:Uncharacterized protein n=1 Tax=Kwoniella heveanensis BCC8398 TaxID=1296120 RepID=A0A1B9H1C5_9TREE|nr:hypothetical protein I316_00980 [Kwoniella heveanensis BCC8398]